MRPGHGRTDIRAEGPVSLATAFLLLAPAILAGVLLAGPAEVGAAPPPFGAGDWTVTGSETVRDGALILDGNLTI